MSYVYISVLVVHTKHITTTIETSSLYVQGKIVDLQFMCTNCAVKIYINFTVGSICLAL